MLSTRELLLETDFPPLNRAELEILQINLGYRCNQQCLHCHVNASPKRTEEMDAETIDDVLAFIQRHPVRSLDLTGGAPELNPDFRRLVVGARALGVEVIDRCNLTILLETGMEDLAEFLAEQGVKVVASLPCYLQENVDGQRGKGTYDASIKALQKLNAFDYGVDGSGLELDLVYNPTGPTLPPPQHLLEADYKKILADDFGISFNRLFTITNMPINRFGSTLLSHGTFDDYMLLLRGAYAESNLAGVMCRNTLSVDWQGYLYDCDFNQMLEMPIQHAGRPRSRLRDCIDLPVAGWPIQVGDHCYACTAGQGSSCGGALSES
jgi:radical SAM/Cys-rich protein